MNKAIVLILFSALVSLLIIGGLLHTDSGEALTRKVHNQQEYPELEGKHYRIRNFASLNCITTYKLESKIKHDVAVDPCLVAQRPIQTFQLLNIMGNYVITTSQNAEKFTKGITYSLYFGRETLINGEIFIKAWLTGYDSNRFFKIVKNADNTYNFVSGTRALQPESINKQARLVLRDFNNNELQRWELHQAYELK